MHRLPPCAGRQSVQDCVSHARGQLLAGHFKCRKSGQRRTSCTVASSAIAQCAAAGAAAAAVGGAVIGCATWRAALMKADIRTEGQFNLSVLSRCSALLSECRRFFLCFNGHAETIWGAWLRRHPRLALRREILRLDDGGVVSLDWQRHTPQDVPTDAPIVILVAGLAGGSEGTYVQYAMQTAGSMGMRSVVFNCRGTAGGPVTTPQFYSASYTMDLRAVVAYLQKTQPGVPLLAMGWSLGANILLNYLGEEGQQSPIKAAVSLVNPFNLVISDKALKIGVARLYDRNLGLAMRKLFQPHVALFRGHAEEHRIQAALNAQTVRDFDDAITRVSFGWPSVDAYYRASGSCNKISGIQVPFLCLQALDDPIAVKEAIPYDQLKANTNCTLVLTPTGGHLGWVQATAPFGAPWSDVAAVEWLVSVLQELEDRDTARCNDGGGRRDTTEGATGNGAEPARDDQFEAFQSTAR
ncbi:unnamed protein product [Ostreobium quekettii]|uniref:AB hydrolase-1 domain-containing protein n=1 Tax=Ostreobium quekettii TaxID=121088 RepID=A0A8S1JD38_9CHLO|nr:unnamed protein product [Ostreobium quekettii]